MTDGRYPERWLNDRRLVRLSDAAHRTFVTALVWSVSNRTDGEVDLADLELIPRARADTVAELERFGLVKLRGDVLVLVDFAATQTSRDELEVLDNARRRDREKKARQRAEKAEHKGDDSAVSPGTSPGTGPRDSTGQDRPGQDRKAGTYGTNIKNGDDEWPDPAPTPAPTGTGFDDPAHA